MVKESQERKEKVILHAKMIMWVKSCIIEITTKLNDGQKAKEILILQIIHQNPFY